MVSTTKLDRPSSLPPLWLACAAVASAWGALFSVARWIGGFQRDPVDIDFRAYYYAAKLGVEQGWSQIYNQDALRALIARYVSGQDAVVNSSHTYPNPPLLAWLVAPLTPLPYAAALVAWTLIGLAALLITWWLASPYRGLARITLLLLALALWPIHYSLVLGQPIPEILALVAGAWWLMRHERPILAGLLIALATALKPQDVILVPFALLFVRQPRVFIAWAGGCAVLAIVFVLSLGTSGLVDFWNTTLEVEGDPWHHYWTWAFFAGPGLLAQILEGGSAVAALAVAWRQRANLELVMAAALIGSVLSAVHAHETDAAMYVLAAWLVLRSNSTLASRLWLLAGIVAVQATALGLVWPVFLWALVWLFLLGQAAFSARQRIETPNGMLARATIADSEPKTAPSTALSGPGAGKLKSESVERA